MEIVTRNVNSLFSDMLWRFKTSGVEADSRNGKVIRIDEPVLTTIKNPKERVLFFGERDSNPIFHVLESIYLLAGRRDVAFLSQFNSSIGNYSDDGEVFNAAYGFRTRNHFGFDQLKSVISILSKDKESRQCVVQLWDPEDLDKHTLDKCCNMQLVFSIKKEKLDILIMNRSNDAIWGYAGANPVHFSILQEFVAGALGREVGSYHTVSNNLHIYRELYPKFNHFLEYPPDPSTYDMYRKEGVKPMSLGVTPGNWEEWLGWAEVFCLDPFTYNPKMPDFLTEVCHPMAMVSKIRKSKSGDGMGWARSIVAQDWQIATMDWVERREAAKVSK